MKKNISFFYKAGDFPSFYSLEVSSNTTKLNIEDNALLSIVSN